MDFERKRKTAFAFDLLGFLLIIVGFILFLATLPCRRLCQPISLPISAWLVPLIAGCVMLCIGAWLKPKFWWGRTRFTTPTRDPLHECQAPSQNCKR